MSDKLGEGDILHLERGANFFGQESKGYAQLRGNGVLVITGKELYFEMWMPERELSVPLSSILRIETPRFYLGKTKGYPLLKVVFRNSRGEVDSMAWMVRDLSKCKRILGEARSRGLSMAEAPV